MGKVNNETQTKVENFKLSSPAQSRINVVFSVWIFFFASEVWYWRVCYLLELFNPV